MNRPILDEFNRQLMLSACNPANRVPELSEEQIKHMMITFFGGACAVVNCIFRNSSLKTSDDVIKMIDDIKEEVLEVVKQSHKDSEGRLLNQSKAIRRNLDVKFGSMGLSGRLTMPPDESTRPDDPSIIPFPGNRS